MLLKIDNLIKTYNQGDGSHLTVLDNLNFSMEKSSNIAIMGESGSGKTTLLNCLSGLDSFDSGTIKIINKNISSLKSDELADFRNKKLGFVFQFHHLLKEFTVLENVMMPCFIAGINKIKSKEQAMELLSALELTDKIKSSSKMLSGGEQQRVAIARALVMKPKLIVMDEPTGNLDARLSVEIITYILKLCKLSDTNILMATHNINIANMMDKIYIVKNHKIQEKNND